MTQLDMTEQAAVRRAQEAARARLPEIAAGQAAATPSDLGHPPPSQAAAAAAGFATALRAAA